MATYASTSNPFIKPNELSPRRSLCCVGKKDAPGMAMPQSSVSRANQPDTSKNLMNINDTSPQQTPTKKASKDKINLLEVLDENKELADESDESSHCRTIIDDEITKACESLVEMTVRMEIEEIKEVEQTKTDQPRETNKLPPQTNERIDEEIILEEDDEDEEEELDDKNDGLLVSKEQDTRQHQHLELIKKLRLQLRDLERYAYERGELEQVPPSVLAERQSVILDTLKERLSLNISRGEIERLELDELKKQVDKEIHDLIDPLITKEYLLSQLKTQLTDLERYITHLHGTIGKIHDKRGGCSCQLHGCSSGQSSPFDKFNNNGHFKFSRSQSSSDENDNNSETLPKTSRLIRSLVTQLICSDIKLRESVKKENCRNGIKLAGSDVSSKGSGSCEHKTTQPNNQQFNNDAAWSLHIDRVILATDSLVNLFTLSPQHQKRSTIDKPLDTGLIESIVRRQLVPAIRDLLSFGLIDHNSMPHSTSYVSILFDPYYILSSLTCFPTSQSSNSNNLSSSSNSNKIHIWNIIEDYYQSKNEPGFKSSSVKTLSQSFNLAPSMSGPIKITSKQALLIAVEDIIETLAKCRPNGPESHFRSFIYTALNKSKLTTWLRLIFKNKSVNRKYYYNFSYPSQPDKMDKFLATLEALNQFEFKLRTDLESIEQFVSAF